MRQCWLGTAIPGPWGRRLSGSCCLWRPRWGRSDDVNQLQAALLLALLAAGCSHPPGQPAHRAGSATERIIATSITCRISATACPPCRPAPTPSCAAKSPGISTTRPGRPAGRVAGFPPFPAASMAGAAISGGVFPGPATTTRREVVHQRPRRRTVLPGAAATDDCGRGA